MRFLVITILFFISACASAPAVDPAFERAVRAPLVCRDVAECSDWWQRAQVWIARNSAYRIQTATDAVISTFGPFGGKTDLAFQVTRLPRTDGGAEIHIRAVCDNMFGCHPSQIDAIVAFKQFVRGA
jgi:hypothetical protein